ncbi:MAG: nitrogenase, partial [Methanospirillum sp.]|uniref:nitrogenase component 1 n=1 Tax=Methanospirillum sp. TaxID=45200 RepID=UPI00237149D5
MPNQSCQGRDAYQLPDQHIDLKNNTCPNREERGGFGIKAYYGTASELVQDAKEGRLKHQERAFEQAGGCILNFFMTQRIATIRDGVMIVHAPVGCSSLATGYRELYRQIPVELGRPANLDFHWLTTNLTEKDVVFGGAEKLKTAIREAEARYAPKSIFILTSCASGVIGDDVEGAVNEVQPEIKARIVPIHCEGHRSRVIQTTYDALWHGILKYLVKKPE